MCNDIWSKALDYYFDSEHYYKAEVMSFFYQYNYYGYCVPEESADKNIDLDWNNDKILLYESDIFQNFNRLSEHFYIKNTQRRQLACRHLNKNLCNEQLAAVIFAIWQGLPENMVNLIADKRRHKKSLDILNALLCGENITQLKTLLSRKENIARKHPNSYFLCVENDIQISNRKYVPAEYTDDGFLVDINKKRYKILP